MLKVLLVNPVIRQTDRPRHVPYGLAQLAAIIHRDGHHLQVFDCNAWRPTEKVIRTVLRADDWDVIAIGGLVTTYSFVKSFITMARQEKPLSRILLGGGIITPIPEDILGLIPEVDIGIIGEGYLTISEILQAIDEGEREFTGIRGIIWRKHDNELILSPGRKLVENVDSIPFPAWDMFPLDKYFENTSVLLSEEAMLSKRRLDICCSYGCPYKCKYCFHLGLSGEVKTELVNGKYQVKITDKRKVRWHSPEYVIELLKLARDKYQVDFVAFLDENFVALDRFTKGNWLDRFETLLDAANLRPDPARDLSKRAETSHGIYWGATCHAALADEALLMRLKAMGCSYLDFGFESFSDEILKAMKKRSTKETNIKALLAAQKAGIRAIPNQILGFPNETVDSILESLGVWIKYNIQAYPFLATPYPGSEWYYEFKDAILEQYNGSLDAFLLDLGDATKVTAVISENFNAVELLGLRELMATRDVKRIIRFKQELEGRACRKGSS